MQPATFSTHDWRLNMSSLSDAEQHDADSENQAPNRSDMPACSASPLTLRQVQVVRCVEQFLRTYGFPPTLRELARMLDMTSLKAVVDHLDRIETKGYIARDRHEARGIRVLIGSDRAALAAPRPLAKTRPTTPTSLRRTA
jgi:repressor LexA